MKIKITILILSIIYSGYLLTILVANHYESIILNPLNSEYLYKNGLFAKAIEAEPTKAEYHMSYALDLIKKNQNPDTSMLKLILIQFKQAIELKPFSKRYKEIYDIYAIWINKQL
jgi:hypothetical protein